MTTRELSGLFYIKKLIKEDEERIAVLEARAEGLSSAQDGMPHNPSHDTMERNVLALDAARKRLERRKAEQLKIEMEIEELIDQTDNPQIQLIMTYRFIRLMKWDEVAAQIGGGNTKDTVKKTFYRFLKKTQ